MIGNVIGIVDLNLRKMFAVSLNTFAYGWQRDEKKTCALAPPAQLIINDRKYMMPLRYIFVTDSQHFFNN